MVKGTQYEAYGLWKRDGQDANVARCVTDNTCIVVLASDYAAQAKQARALALEAVSFAGGWGYAGKQQTEADELKQIAQAVLDATEEG